MTAFSPPAAQTGNVISIRTGGSATVLVAASNADARTKAQADYVCDGTNDEVEINAAIESVPDIPATEGGSVELSTGKFFLGNEIVIDKYNLSLIGRGGSYAQGGAEPNQPRSGGTVLQVTSSFAGTYAIRSAPTNPGTRSLFGVKLAGFSIDGFGSGAPFVNCSGIFWQVILGSMYDIQISRLQQVGIIIDGGGSAVYPLGAWDNRIMAIKISDCGSDLMQIQNQASDNVLMGCKFVGETTGTRGRYGVNINDGPGTQIIGCHFFFLKDYCLRANARQLQVAGVRFTDSYGGAIYVDGTLSQGGGFNFSGLNLRDVNLSGGAAIDAIHVEPTGVIRGGAINGITLLSTTDTARPRFLVNIASANATGVEVGGLSAGYTGSATDSVTTGILNDLGTNTLDLTSQAKLDRITKAEGMIAETGMRKYITANSALITQVPYLVSIYLTKGQQIANIGAIVGQAGTGTTPTTIKMGIADAGGIVRAVTGNLNADAKWGTVGLKTFALTSTYAVPSDGLYYVVILENGAFGTQVLQLARCAAITSAAYQFGSGPPDATAGTGGQTDITVSQSLGFNIGQVPLAFWFGLS